MSIIACVISNLLSAAIFALGCSFIALPSTVISILSNEDDNVADDQSVQTKLSKLVGGILIAYIINIVIFLEVDSDVGTVTVTEVKACNYNHRIALTSQSMLGLVILFLGLVENIGEPMLFIGIGSSIVLLGCIGLMASFNPFNLMDTRTTSSSTSTSASSARHTHTDRTTDSERPANTVPLLEESLQEQEQDVESSNQPNPNQDANLEEHAFESRITGTKRLMKLAGPHTYYLYTGCMVLLIRLPFSLSIPHFVSATLGALARANYEEAKMNIFFLFVLGTVDAALDFWCVFLFGLTNLKITKGVRIDTFASILKQEMAFFDFTKSGDLTSRLNSDCGEMGYDLTWFFRFSIESVVRIVSIVSYMLYRSPQLGVCAISVVSLKRVCLCLLGIVSAPYTFTLLLYHFRYLLLHQSTSGMAIF